VATRSKLFALALAGLCSILGCQRCGGGAATGSSGDAPATRAPDGGEPAASAAPPAAAAAETSLPVADVPEVRDEGDGRATAALRAVLGAYGVAFDADALLKECNVDDDGASIDDLEDVAVKYGLEAGSVIAPVEHVLLPEAKMLPAIVVLDGADDEQDFAVAWRLDGDRVQVMDPRQGRRWVPRADLQKMLHVHEMTMPADEYREAVAAPAFGAALLGRAAALGVDAASARTPLDKASADPGWRGLAALDAALRKLAGAAPGDGGAGASAQLAASFGCAFEKRCDGVEPVPPALWSAQPAPKDAQGEAQVKVRGAVLLAIAGRASSDGGEPRAPAPAAPSATP
jgi:hypothetical protein